MRKLLFLLCVLGCMWASQSCYYDKYDELYPAAKLKGCDTVNISFATNVSKIFTGYCSSCHGATLQGGGFRMDSYTEIKKAATAGRLIGAIRQETGFKPMPQGARLDDCRIRIIEKWAAAGYPNN